MNSDTKFAEMQEQKREEMVEYLKNQRVCTGCGFTTLEVGRSENKPCCPDSNYINIFEYFKKSVYAPHLLG